jgi:hypothetical protein
MPASRRTSFTAAHGVIDRVHGNTSHFGPSAQPAPASGFAQIDIFMAQISQLTDGRPAVQKDHSNLSGWEFEQRISLFLGHQLCIGARTPDYLSAFSRAQFDVVYMCTERDVGNRQRISRLDIDPGT